MPRMRFSHITAKLVFVIIVINSLACSIFGQIIINEFQASNSSTIEDSLYLESSDWVELFNTSSTPFNLGGFYLTDNLGNSNKWEFPAGTTIPPKGYLLIWTDGMDQSLHTSFKLSQLGEEIGLFSPNLDLMDSVSYPLQKSDISCGRISDGDDIWGYFPVPTPGASNNTVSYEGWVDHVPEFSVLGGLFNAPFQVSLSTPFEGIIRYTLDGSEPSDASPIFETPISINSTRIIRSRIFIPDKIPGTIVTHSYFLNEDFETRHLPIISIATNPANFWDTNQGIYVQDFKPDWEVPINIELFENDGSDRASFNELAGTKVNGLYSWQLPQKMLGIYFRKKYGNNKLKYPLFDDRDRSSFNSFALRASGSDWSYTLFRDGLAQRLTNLNMENDMQGFRPCIVYVNGEYLGVHNIRSKVDEDFIAQNHSLEPGSFDMVEYEDYAEAGDLNAYTSFKELLSGDLSIQSNYERVDAEMDIENFTDFMITEIAVRNTSITHNVMAWKPKEGGKWKWILMDLDRGFFSAGSRLLDYYIDEDVVPLKKLLENEDYKNYFGRRLADQLYTSFNYERVSQLVNEHQTWIENEIPYHIDRWQGTTSSYGDAIPSVDYWYQEVCELKEFAKIRPQAVLSDLQSLGFDEPANLSLSVYPARGGIIYMNSLIVPGESWLGAYPKNQPIELEAKNKPGYRFTGWREAAPKSLISKNSSWKYKDNGSDPGNDWHEVTYSDADWSVGAGELGYGDGDEQTVISYGGDANNKYITSYFRKTFEISPEESLPTYLQLNLLCDDGAIVYLNGQEVLRSNMGCGSISSSSLAVSSIGSSAESVYIPYKINSAYLLEGQNLIAVEIHQASSNSSDLSFDLELIGYEPATSGFISTNAHYTITLSDDRNLIACYEENGQCILPELITEDLTLSKYCSPYVAQTDVTIATGAVLTIDEGVEIWMPANANIFVHGSIQAAGSENERILIRANPEYSENSWGALCFDHSDGPSSLTYMTIEDASEGPVPYRDVAAISSFYSGLFLDHLIIENVNRNPISARYSDISLTNSQLHSSVTGDLINVKYGHATISNCRFEGNNQPDTDAIDYDGIENGVVRNSIIYNFFGLNSDAIDIGEKTENTRIDSLWVYNITDKGISVGQQSTVSIENSVFTNCNLGLGLKDSCRVVVDRCTFYGNATAVACFEKNPGSAGGNILLQNSILSNSYDNSYSVDNRSAFMASHCLSDNDPLPGIESNLFGDPLFENPSLSDFNLKPGSPCIESGIITGSPVDIGSHITRNNEPLNLMFNNIFYNLVNEQGKSEFLSIYNPATETIDLTGYQITTGIEYTFPEGITIGPSETVFLVKDITNPPANYYHGRAFQWEKGSLANEGETIRLQDKYGIILDQVKYSPEFPWPVPERNNNVATLKSSGLDNHFGENWSIVEYNTLVHFSQNRTNTEIQIFPNPTSDIVYIQAPEYAENIVSVYSVTGQLLTSFSLDENGFGQIGLSRFQYNLIFVKLSDTVYKVVISHD